MEEQLRSLAEAGIALVPAEMSRYYVLERDGLVCLVEKREGGFGAIGAVCKLLDGGFAVATSSGSEGWWVAKGVPRVAATAGEMETYRAFSRDLRAALEGQPESK